MFSTLSTISSLITQVSIILTGIPSLVVKHLFIDTENSTDSNFTNLDLVGTTGFNTDGLVNIIESSGTALDNYIINYTNLSRLTPGVTIMFKMRLTPTNAYLTTNTRRCIVRTKAENIEDCMMTISLTNNNTNASVPPILILDIFPLALSGTGNNKLINRYGLIPSANMAYDDMYHHYCFTITETNSSGNYFTISSYKNGTQIGTPVSNNGDTNADHYGKFLNMKRISLFPSQFTISGSSTMTFPPAKCIISDFRIYQKILDITEINICKNGDEISL